MAETREVWLVERTYSDDEQNLIILTYATPDGRLEYRKERAITSFSGPARETTAGATVPRDDLATVSEPDRRERFAAEASRMAETHDSDEPI
jgi:hypothetical protein